MSSDAKTKVSSEIKPYLDEIAERLWSNHAAVMIGSGFSRNAHKIKPSASDFPLWTDLANNFYEKLNQHRPNDNTSHYLNPLKLADEVQAAFGRPTLDQILRTRIPNKDHEPAEIHVKLLELPWVDVFTVNYDTLLERATDKVSCQRFDVVETKEDLVYSTRPRIIKLHGSFPSTRPFTISEEDYRRYPREQAPFVNTVQQALLENTLCLIGFSGDDPNFLHWIGWVRDNLGMENSPKIYFVGALTLTEAQRKLLEQRNVVLVDMNYCNGVDGNHKKAINEFLDYLTSQNKRSAWSNRLPNLKADEIVETTASDKSISTEPPTSQSEIPLFHDVDWPHYRDVPKQSNPKTAEEFIHLWRHQREEYPNWVIAPAGARESISLSLQFERYGIPILNTMEAVPPCLDLEFLYELNWRLELILCPIFSELINHFENILNKYNPYPDLITHKASYSPRIVSSASLDWERIGKLWISLNLSLLRAYRECSKSKEWAVINERLRTLAHFMSPDQIARWHYESCLSSLFDFEIKEVRKRLTAWPTNSALPFWEAKRAGLLAEFGDLTEAVAILQDSLASIRSKQQLSPVVKDFTWVSQECHVMYLLHIVKTAYHLSQTNRSEHCETRDQFQQRWYELMRFKCDPRGDLNLYDIRLKAPRVNREPITRTKEFDIGRVTVSQHWSISNEDTLLGYSLLRYCEETGLPFVLPSLNIAQAPALQAAKRISNTSAAWAIVTLLRLGDAKAVDSFFGREALASITIEAVDRTIDWFLAFVEKENALTSPEGNIVPRNLVSRIMHVIPEVLSRLCTKCSSNKLDAIFGYLQDLYSTTSLCETDGIPDLTKRLFECMPRSKQCEIVPLLIEFTVLGEKSGIWTHSYPEPFLYLSLDVASIKHFQVVQLSTTTLDSLLAKTASLDKEERNRSSLRLGRLCELGMLNIDQRIVFANALWSQRGQYGFPVKTPFYAFAFLTLPAPEDINVEHIFREYIVNWMFTSIDNAQGGLPTVSSSGKAPVNLTQGRIAWCSNVLGATKRGNKGGPLDWNDTEVRQILCILKVWWDADKDRLHEQTSISDYWVDVQNEYRARYRNIPLILADVIAPRLTADTEDEVKKCFESMVDELNDHGFSVLRVRAASLHICPQWGAELFKTLREDLAGVDKDRINDACKAIPQLLNRSEACSSVHVVYLLAAIGQVIKWRREKALVLALDTVRVIVDELPLFCSGDFEKDVAMGLGKLGMETNPLVQETIPDIADRLLYRKFAASLAFALFKFYTLKDVPVPSEVTAWQKICADPEEFAEIRNQWGEI